MPDVEITTIIPTYRRPKMLRRAIKSVLLQTHPHFKVLVLDNASGDETPEVVSELAGDDPRIEYHCHDDNIGAFENFQYGLRQVQTPFFSFLSDDDALMPHCFEVAMGGLERHPDAAFSGGMTVDVDTTGRILCTPQVLRFAEGRHEPPDGGLDICTRYNLIWTSLVFRRSVLDRVGYLSPDAGLVADTEFEARIGLRYPFVFTRRPCAYILRHTGRALDQNPTPSAYYSRNADMMKALTACDDLPDGEAARVRRALRKKLNVTMIRRAMRLARRGQFEAAREMASSVSGPMGMRTTGAMLKLFNLIARFLPPLLWPVNWVLNVRDLRYESMASRTQWEGKEEAEKFLHLLDLE